MNEAQSKTDGDQDQGNQQGDQIIGFRTGFHKASLAG